MASVKSLAGKVCIVTGATRGIGKGIALQLGAAGATIYITGRTLKRREGDSVGGSLEETAAEVKEKGGDCIPVQCDHSKDADIKALFDRVSRKQDGQLDVLVNNAFSGVQIIAETYKKSFWEQDPKIWDAMNEVGLRSHYICSVYAAKLMVARKRGLIVNVSSHGGLTYHFNVANGVGKAGVDRMAVDCAKELKEHNIAFVSLWPGLTRTERINNLLGEKGFGDGEDVNILEHGFSTGETPEYSGLAIAHLAADPNVMKKTGRVLIGADLGNEYGFVDVDAKTGKAAPFVIPSMRRFSMRELGYALTFATENPIYMKIIPRFIKIPCWVLSLAGSKF